MAIESLPASRAKLLRCHPADFRQLHWRRYARTSCPNRDGRISAFAPVIFCRMALHGDDRDASVGGQPLVQRRSEFSHDDRRTLGEVGKWICWGTFLFLFYSVLVAYVTASGDLFTDCMQTIANVKPPSWMGSLLFTLLFAVLIYCGTGAVDQFNRVLMAGLIAAYLLLLFVGAPYVKTEYLEHTNWKAALLVVPPMVISFGYHNLIPSLTTYLGRDRRKMVISVLIGSFIPLAIYLLWEWLILGTVPLEGIGGSASSR